MKTEPEKKRKKSNTLVGDDLLKQFVNKQINLTFYSGKIWHSEKPFPKRPFPVRETTFAKFPKTWEAYDDDLKSWLSTAYEVVNPEVIPGMDDYFSGYTKPVDGDQITLPAGYGTKWDTVNPCREVRKCLNERPDGDTCNQFNGAVCQRIHTVAVITMPEKLENSSNGYTDAMKATLSDCPWIKSEEVKSCIRCEGTGETSPDNQCKRCEGTGIEEHQDLCEKPVVEPSESQEEDQIDLLSEILVDYKTWLDDPESGMRDYETFQAKQLEKFTITRK